MNDRIWAVTSTEMGMPETVLYEYPEGVSADEPTFLIFTDAAYGQAVAAFNRMRDERLSYHKVTTVGRYGPDAHARLYAYDGDDAVELRPYNVIGG
jgi:hypothetical protein